MPALNVFLAPDGPAGGVLDVLTDLSAAGLVAPFLWVVDADVSADPRNVEIAAVAVAGGVRSPATVGSALADSSYDRRRLCVVVPLGGPEPAVPMEQEQRLLSLVSFAGGNAAVTPIRVLVARPGDHADPGLLDRAGWHNIYLAPEDARGPGEARELLGRSDDPVEIGRHAAPAVAGVVGLWNGNERTPLDDHPAPTGVRAGRAFYRRIDASDVERDLRSRVLTTRAPLPVPRDHMASADYADDAGSACRVMAGTWWERHRAELIGPRVQPVRPEPLPTGAVALLKLFFRYIGARFRNAPGDWLRGIAVKAYTDTARMVHGVVLGSGDSAYTVVVKGITDKGLPAGWRELGAASSALDDHLAASGMGSHALRPDLRRTWEDYAFGSMTLADAGRHGAMGPYQPGANPAVLRSPVDIVPPPDHDFTEIPGYLHADVGDRVPIGDVLSAESVRRKLIHIGQDPNQAADVGRTLQALDRWQATHQHTYSVQVGNHLAQSLLGTVEEIRGYVDWLARAAAEEAADAAEPSHRFSVWMTWILGVLAVAGLVTGPVLAVREVVRLPTAILITVLPLVLWLVFVVSGFVREWREAFRDLLRRRETASRVTAVRANLRQATIDVRRLADAYEQYLVWSRVVGSVLHDPFGPVPRPGGAGTAITHGLPRTTRIARAQVDENVTGFASAALRADFFGTGWLGRLWLEHLQGAGRQLNRHDLVDDRWEGLLDLRGGVRDSALLQWARFLGEHGTSPASGTRLWAAVMESLRGRHQKLAESLLSSVHGIERGDQRPLGLAEFLTGVDEPMHPARTQQFDTSHFTAQATADDRAAVDLHVPMQAQVGLSRVDVLVQLSVACPAWDFAVTEQLREEAGPGHGPPPAHPDVVVPEPGASGPGHEAVPQAPKGFL
jgi:hypothetical protein